MLHKSKGGVFEGGNPTQVERSHININGHANAINLNINFS